MKVALITGGGSGIGQSISWALARKNIRVYIVGRHIEKLATTIKPHPNLIHPIVADITTQNGINIIVNGLNNASLNYLIHNAGQEGKRESLELMSRENWHGTHTLNVEAPLFLTQALLPKLQKEARILLISSMLAHSPLVNFSAYCASKAALNMLGKSFNLEFNKKHIFTGICDPGPVDTAMQERLRTMESADSDEKFFDIMKSSGQLTDPKHVAEFIVDKLLSTSNEQFVKNEWIYAK